MNPGTDPYREWDAAYVLGALAPDERRDYEQHLAVCAPCREAVAELAGMPGLLGTVPRDVATAAAPAAPAVPGPADAAGDDGLAPVVPLAALAGRARRRRTRVRTLLGVAAAGLVVAGGLGGAAVVGGEQAAPPVLAGEARTVTLTPVGGSGVTADLTLTAAGWGTRLDWWCEYTAAELAEGVYELVVVDEDGGRSVVGTWTSTGDRTAAGLGASVAVPSDGIRRVELGVVGLDVPLAAVDVPAGA
ncbi:anti-sigma factor family protein [Cellulomonas shaoxiangyii]|uniref:Zf-HC2 domain-containing protein n=2 Tax=Cellulomonas shaoxiangyii TaxID=2566013 RepID=A0A4P7SMG6_9CELL|nr:zf-HC2 domain-containing protein [Cellulomonas shaoxiangyii]QCB94968.1 zf-HC2 domain-containing protein [Cellulomonas shaoxiangyii]